MDLRSTLCPALLLSECKELASVLSTLFPLKLRVNPRSKRHHIDIMCADPTSDGRRIDAHDVNMMSF